MPKWDPRALAVLERLEEQGYKAVLVGGCVRDCLLGTAPHDYDAATAARPEEMLRVFAGWHVVETGKKHGTLTIFSDGLPVEVTTFRKEGEYTDHRRPDSVEFTDDLAADLARRDFTVNAMAWGKDGLTDLFGGQEDLKDRILRCVGQPKRRFEEDALRILRCLRFSAQLGFAVEERTAAALKECMPLLEHISRERVAAEFMKLICAPEGERVLLQWPEAAVQVVPELKAAVGFDQKTPYHCYDVYTHSVHVMGCVERKPVMRLAGLLHDLGKPFTFAPDEKGVGHFPNHAKVGAELADGALRRLRLDNATREQVVTLVSRHGMRLPAEERVVRRWLSRLGQELFFDLMALDRADNMAKRPEMVPTSVHWTKLNALAQRLLEEEPCLSLRDLAVGGRDAVELGLRGAEIGKALRELLEQVVEHRLPNERDVLLEELKKKV